MNARDVGKVLDFLFVLMIVGAMLFCLWPLFSLLDKLLVP